MRNRRARAGITQYVKFLAGTAKARKIRAAKEEAERRRIFGR